MVAVEDVVDVTMEGADGQAEEQVVELGRRDEREEKGEEDEEKEVVDVDEDQQQEREEEEQKHEESEDDEVQFVGSVGVEGNNDHQEVENEEDVVVLENGDTSDQGSSERSRANTDALLVANGYVTPATLEAELQFFVSINVFDQRNNVEPCASTYYSFLAKQYPDIKIVVAYSICSFDVVAQLLIPSVAERISSYQQEEEVEFTSKLQELDSKWKLFNLSENAARYHGDHDEEGARSSGRWEEDHEGHEEYPVVKVEHTEDGNLHVFRNIVLDTNDENEDGYVNMRVGIAIVEFPSIFELYNEHQECSVNVIKMEEDEETADGMPFFMNEDGDDDGFVCGSYYNEISLRVCDEGVRDDASAKVCEK
ncbi:unnamed protein product [Phytophthora fragariaefolia]|uniref:Unnamed protein product n=1 Tax=Phytophthora fragariaefolia TaxID=1490495 RepID=A0A9W7D4H7_9STRA|nr:unnamed protein product [Phytophthora fragariaefolia]